MRAILTFGDVVRIEDIARLKNEPPIETGLVIVSIGYEVTIFGSSISIDIFTIFEVTIRIIQSGKRSFFYDFMDLMSDTFLLDIGYASTPRVPVISPPVWLAIHCSFRIWWVYTDDGFS